VTATDTTTVHAPSEPEAQREPRSSWPLALVGVAVAFNLWTLRGETVPTRAGNDSTLHEAMVRWAVDRIASGHSPLDGWFPDFGLGFAQFHQYQSLPHVLVAYVAQVFGAGTTYAWSLYLLLALWPICVFVTMRLFGFTRWSAAAASAVAPLLVAGPSSAIALERFGYEYGSYIWRGHGLWAQLWGMWLLPLSLALTWRAICRRRSMTLAAVVTGLAVACHLLTGYLALIAIGLWVVLVPSQLRTRLGRALIVGAGSLIVVVWMIVPFLADQKYAIYSSLRGSIWADSYGVRRALEWLITGKLFDSGRFPIITIFVGVGVVVCASRWRRDEASRAVLAFFVLSLLLFSGRPTLGAIADVFPGSKQLYFPRFIMGVHLAGIFLAGIGAAWLGARALTRLERFKHRIPSTAVAGAAVVAFVAILTPAWSERADYAAGGRESMQAQRTADAHDGADVAALINETRGSGSRVYAGLAEGSGDNYRIGYVPMYAELVSRGVDSVGFLLRVSALSSAVEPNFNPFRPEHLDLFNVGWAILPKGARPLPTATLVDSRGRHQLWKLRATTGYLEVVDTIGPPITADRTNLRDRMRGGMDSALPAEHEYPTVAFEGDAAAAPTLRPGQAVDGPPGRVLHQFSDPEDGHFGGRVRATRPSVVLLKATYHPRWQVTVDGKPAKPELVAPTFVGVKVPAGEHTIEFRYRPYASYWLWFLLAAGGIVLLVFADRRLSASARTNAS